MPKFIPYKKLSKRKRRERDNTRRVTWGIVNPVTRTVKDGKAYDRKRDKRIERYEEEQ